MKLTTRFRYRLKVLRLAWRLRPIAGADDDGGDGGGGEGGTGGGGGGTTTGQAASGNSGAEARIRQLNDEKKAAEERAEAAEKKLKDAEEKDLSEKEKAERERDEHKARADEAEAKAARLERSTWARTKAQDLGFIDTDVAVALLDLNSLDTQTKVENAVEKLAEEKKHLVGQRPTQGFGTPGGAGTGGGGGEGGDDAARSGPSVNRGAEEGSDEDRQRLEAGRGVLGALRRGAPAE